MEPNNQSPEHLPAPGRPETLGYEPGSVEYGNERNMAQSEHLGGLASTAERFPAAAEQLRQPPASSPAADVSLPAPQDDVAATAVPASDDVPLVAADEDLIEKEWVHKVKRVLAETKDEPYKREQQIKRLQLEYVRKRYGREIGDPGD